MVITEIERIPLFQITSEPFMLNLMPDGQTVVNVSHVTSVTQNYVFIILMLLFSNFFMTCRDLDIFYSCPVMPGTRKLILES